MGHRIERGYDMSTVTVYHYDAFSTVPNKGNPAGVVLEAESLSEAEMQNIAHLVGFNETVFVLKSRDADLRLRYFTPGHEINLCGHATMASLFCLKTRGQLQDKQNIHIETNVGVLPIHFETVNDILNIEMKQDRPKFIPFNGSVDKLAHSLGLTIDDIDQTLPIVYGSTGAWTLLLPIRKLNAFSRMTPNNTLFPDVLIENPKSSVHPFCLETFDNAALMHARHFSSPYSGTIEDPVTGTASGVMGAYFLTFMNKELNKVEFVVEQGQEIGRDGRVIVKAEKSERTGEVEKAEKAGEEIDVRITGTAVFVGEMHLEYGGHE